MPNWTTLPKPAELAENRLVDAILDGTFPINCNLPPERELAEQLGITRPTLREALQRLSRDGWITIHHGRPTRVNDYWKEGNLLILNALSKHPQNLSADFVPNLLKVRADLAPEYTATAVQKQFDAVVNLLKPMASSLPDEPTIFAEADFSLHKNLTILSGNPIYTLIFNGFKDLYFDMGVQYFNTPKSRQHSKSFYQNLLEAAINQDVNRARQVTLEVMMQSIQIWQAHSVHT